jgi:Tol biopolymer transport system component
MQYGWSPTGTQHAALSSDGRLSITGLDGVEHQNVGDLSAVGSFSWSPGGSWLSVSGSSDRILRPDGSGLRDLPGSPTWSPDERRMSISWPEGTLLVGDGDGTGLRAVGSFPPYVVWSQDGSRFAFIRDGDVWTAAADGTDIRNVTAFPLGGASNMAWSPDDRWLAVATTHGAWVMRPDGTDRRGLVFGPSKAMGGLVWAPDTSRLAVEAYSDDTTGQDITIYLLAVDGSAAVRVDAASGPSWSPDGRYLAVGHVTPSSGGGYEIGNLAVMNGNGSGRRDLPVTTNGNWPIWVHPDR